MPMPRSRPSIAPTAPTPLSANLSDRDRRRYQRIRQLSMALDSAITIPGTSIRLGLDPILGLLPVGGDVLSFLISLILVVEAARLGLPIGQLARMVSNLLIDEVVGTIPVAGDLVDVAWKANMANLKLVEDHLQVRSPGPVRVPWVGLAMLLGLLLLAMIGLAACSVWIIGAIGHLLWG